MNKVDEIKATIKSNKKRIFIVLLFVLTAVGLFYGCSEPKDKFKESRRHFQLGLQRFKELNTPEAIMEFNYALYLDPSFPEPHYYLGLAYKKIGSMDEGMRFFKMYLKLKPDHTDTRFQLLQIYHHKGNGEEALKEGKYLLEKLLPDDPATVEVQKIMGDIYLRLRDYEAAAFHFRQVMGYDPQAPESYLAFAKIYMVQDDTDNAIDMLKQLLATNPTHKEARSLLIALYQKKGDLNELKIIYAEMLKTMDPAQVKENAEINAELAQLYWQLNDMPQALKYAEETLKKDNVNQQARYILAKCYLQNKQYKEAAAALEVLQSYNYKLEETLGDLGVAYSQIKNTNKAIETYEKLVFIRPDNFVAQYNMASLCLETQRWDCAIKTCKDIISKFYDFGPAYLFLGRAYLFKEDINSSVDSLKLFFTPEGRRNKNQEKEFYVIAYPNLIPPKQYVDMNKKERDLEGHYLLGEAYLYRQQLDAAINEFNYVLKSKPLIGELYLSKAIAYHLQGEINQAILCCELAGQHISTDKKLVYFMLANLYTSKGDLGQAFKYMKMSNGLIYGFSLDKMEITQNVDIKNPRSLANLNAGVYFLLNGWRSRAKLEFVTVLKTNQHNPLAQYLNNELYQLMNKYYFQSTHMNRILPQIYQK